MTVVEKAGYSICFVIILVLMYFIVFSTNGFLDYRKLRVQETRINDQIQETQIITQELETEILSLKNDMEYIRHVAKHEHDMAEEDELIFRDTPPKKEKP